MYTGCILPDLFFTFLSSYGPTWHHDIAEGSHFTEGGLEEGPCQWHEMWMCYSRGSYGVSAREMEEFVNKVYQCPVKGRDCEPLIKWNQRYYKMSYPFVDTLQYWQHWHLIIIRQSASRGRAYKPTCLQLAVFYSAQAPELVLVMTTYWVFRYSKPNQARCRQQTTRSGRSKIPLVTRTSHCSPHWATSRPARKLFKNNLDFSVIISVNFYFYYI